MKIVDVNILLYVVNRDAAHHGPVRAWWERTINDEEAVGLPWVVALGFLRTSTNRRVCPVPLSVEDALAKLHDWQSLPNVTFLSETESHWSVLKRLLEATGAAGNLTTDAHLAAIAISRSAILVSCDHDFRRFPNLRWENPLQK